MAGAVFAMLVLAASAAAEPPEDVDDPAIPAEDQAAHDADETNPNPSKPRPMSPSGPAADGSYTAELWEPEDSGTDEGVQVVASTASGTYGLTGVIVDEGTLDPLIGATVTIKTTVNDPCPRCLRPPGEYPVITYVSAQTGSDGDFAFINMTPSQLYSPASGGEGWQVQVDLTVTAPGHGTFQHLEYPTMPDETFIQTVVLGTASETRVGATTPSANRSPLPEDLPDLGGYLSRRHPPPWITVAEFRQDAECRSVGTYRSPPLAYSWRGYLTKVVAKEAGGFWRDGGWFDEQATKAVALASHQFAWHFRIKRGGGLAHGGADIDNTVNSFQCFDHTHGLPWRRFKLVKAWVEDVIDERVVTAAGQIPIFQHASGAYRCTEQSGTQFAPGRNFLSQFGAKAQEETCGKNYSGAWRDIADYYLGTDRTIVPALKPPAPHTSFTTGDDVVHLSFSSRVRSTQTGRLSDVAFRYYILKRVDGGTWKLVRWVGFKRSARRVPTSWSHEMNGCAYFKIAASNPVGLSAYDAVNNDQQATQPARICV